MNKIIHTLLIPLVFALSAAHANQASQTSWIGNTGCWGPHTTWDTRYYHSFNIDWGSIPGQLMLQPVAKHQVGSEFDGAFSVCSGDIDGDGDIDVLGAACKSDEISWWENPDCKADTTWVKHIIEENFDYARSVYSVDIDNDGDMDVIGAAWDDSLVVWWENVEGTGLVWTNRVVDSNFSGASTVYAEDIDNDGDQDIIGGAAGADKIFWWENVNAVGTLWNEHVVDLNFDDVLSVYAEDINGDGNMDILGAAFDGNCITWWENQDGLGTLWTEHLVAKHFVGSYSVYSQDIDNDSDMDIIAVSAIGDEIAWWENVLGSGTFWIKHSIDSSVNDPTCVRADDIDGDGDMDVLASVKFDNALIWWENTDGVGTEWAKHVIDSSIKQPSSICTDDIDGNGHLDVIAAAYQDDCIVWLDLTAEFEYVTCGTLESTILDTQIEAVFGFLNWNFLSTSNTSICFQIRSSDNYSNMGAWSDTLSMPDFLYEILNKGDRYVQYKVILYTSSPTETPILYDVTVYWENVGMEEMAVEVPSWSLHAAENPSHGYFSALVSVPEPGLVKLFLFDVSGRVVAQTLQEFSKGVHSVNFAGLAEGVYFCRMRAGEFSATERIVVLD